VDRFVVALTYSYLGPLLAAMLSLSPKLIALLAVSVKGFRTPRQNGAVDGDAAGDCFSMYDGMPLLNLAPCTEDAAKMISDFTVEHECTLMMEEDELHLPEEGGCAEVHAVCDAASAAKLEASVNFGDVRVVEPDAGAYYRQISGFAEGYVSIAGADQLSSDFYTNWRDLSALDARVEAAVAASGGAAKIETAGKSLEGRTIKLVRFTGKGYSPGKPKLVLTFNVHAREWITGMSGVYAVERLAAQAKNINFLAGVEVVMVYMANPDGFIHTIKTNRFHRKNTRKGCWRKKKTGVDLNRNFNISWSTKSSNLCSMDTFHGKSAMSEPETRVLAAIMEETKMSVYIDVHSYTQVIMYSWGYRKEDVPRKAEFEALGRKMLRAVENKHSQSYKFGQISQVLTTGSGSGTDYATKLGALGFAYELRPKNNQGMGGFAPPTNIIQPAAEECYEGILAAIAYIKA